MIGVSNELKLIREFVEKAQCCREKEDLQVSEGEENASMSRSEANEPSKKAKGRGGAKAVSNKPKNVKKKAKRNLKGATKNY